MTRVQLDGTLLPELVQWLPRAALDEPIGSIGATALRLTSAIRARSSRNLRAACPSAPRRIS